MPIGILGERRNVGPQISYVPVKGGATRTYTLFRATTVLGQSKVKPLVMCDTDFWANAAYAQIIQAIADSVSRDWTTPQQAGTRKSGAGINVDDWDTLRGKKYQNTEMLGAMVAKLTYGTDAGQVHAPTDYVVSAAPNMLYSSKKGAYLDHTKGDNAGGQIHAEMSMGAQLCALVDALKGTRGFLASKLKIDADLFIEKTSMCDGCLGTWNKIIEAYPGSQYRST